MKPTTLLAFMALAGGAAASPYDTPYGVQWNFMIGTSGNDMGGGSRLAVTSDGTVFVQNRTGVSTWGEGTGGNVRGGLGAITPLGNLLYGTTVASLPTMNAPGQNYAAGVHAAGNKAFFTIYGAQGQYWNGEDGKDGNRAMVWSLDSSGLGSIADQRSLSLYTNDSGNPLRTDGLQPTTTGLTPATGSNRIAASSLRDSTLDMVMVMDMVAGDFATLGDYEGYGLRSNGTGNAFLPGIGVYNFTTNTLSGPAKQPIVTYSGATGSNFATYFAAGIDQSTGWYYGGGASHTRNESTSDAWDPDASGPAASIPFSGGSSGSATRAGIGTAYNESGVLQYAVTWDTSTFDTINFIAPTNDGSNSCFWAGEKGDQCHIELIDSTGNVVWSDSFFLATPAAPGDPPINRIASVDVLPNGDIIVACYFEKDGVGGSASYDLHTRKYKKTAPNTYTLEWEQGTGLDGIPDFVYDTATDSDQTLYALLATQGQWPTTTGYVYAGSNDLLVQKMIPGDFNADGIVDFANDVQTVGAATQPAALIGDDTYDFNKDGDSTFPDDVNHLITVLMDRNIGDIHQDLAVTDVDNADIGKAIGSLGTGTLYLDGDIDFDGDVDATDLASITGAFTGALSPARGPVLPTGTTLTYIADVGTVVLSADGAAGGVITSFQLESGEGTFVNGSFTGPTGGSFGGAYAQATANVLADSDTTLAGASGDLSLGSVFPIGMDQAGLEAYLTTAVYTGAQGTGQMQFDLVVLPTLPTPYETWASGFPSLTDPDAGLDFENDGLKTGIEYVVGGDPTVNDAASVAPTSEENGSGLVFTYRRTDSANADPATTIVVEYGSDLTGWTPAEHATDGVSIAENDDFYGTGIDQVIVTLPNSLAIDGKLFARLSVTGLPENLYMEDFESGDGGYTVATASGTDWAHGIPNATGIGGDLNTANSPVNVWGTNLTGPYTTGTDSKLRSAVIDLTGVATATLSFAQELDLPAASSVVVNVIEESTDTILEANVHTSTDADDSVAEWETVDSIAITGGSKVRIEWHFVGGGDGSYLGVSLDDVKISTP